MTIFKLGGMAQKKNFNGPAIGVKVASQNKRNFSEDKLRQGQSIIGLQVCVIFSSSHLVCRLIWAQLSTIAKIRPAKWL